MGCMVTGDFSFAEFMRKAEKNEIEEQLRNCVETTGRHSDPDEYGKCCYCRRKIGPKAQRPMLDHKMRSILDDAYGYFYDPDYEP